MTELIIYKPSVIRNGFFNDYSIFSWSQSGVGSWTFRQGYANHNGDGPASIFQENVLFLGVEYRIKIKVTGLSSGGTVTVDAGNTYVINTNGVWEFDLVSTSKDFSIESSGINCTVSNISVVEAPGSFSLDTGDDVLIPITYSIDDIKNPSARSTSYSKTVTLPGTKNNNRIFNQIYEIGSGSLFNSNKRCDCVVLEDGIEVFKGGLCLDEINRFGKTGIDDYDDIEYNVTLIGELGSLFNAWADKKLSDLDFSEYDHEFGRDSIYNSWFGKSYVNGVITNMYTETLTYTVSSIASASFDGQDRVKVTFTGSHGFNVGDEVFGWTNNNLLSGFQTVLDKDSTSITLNLLWNQLTDTSTPTGTFTNYTLEGKGYVYPMIDMGEVINSITHDQSEVSSGPLEIGSNYIFKRVFAGDNFSNVGALVFAQGYAFTATGQTPTTWTNGTILVKSDVDNWRISDFYPALFFREILDKCFKLIGYTYEAPLFDTSIFKRIIMPWANGETFELTTSRKRQIEVRASMQDTISEPSGHTFEDTYLLYPYPANHGDFPEDNENVQPGTLGPPFNYFNPHYQNIIFWCVDFNYDGYNPSSNLYFDGKGSAVGTQTKRNRFVQGCTYQVVDGASGDNFTDVGGPGSPPPDNTIFISTKTGINSGNWSNSSTIQPLSPFASHHRIPQSGGSITTFETSPIPFNNDQAPTDYDDGGNWSTVLYQFEFPSAYIYGADMNFSFSGYVWNYVKDPTAYNGSTGDLPSDYAGSSAPGIYAVNNGTYIGGHAAAEKSPDRTDINMDFYNGIIIQKSTDGGSSWTNLKYLGTNGDSDPYSVERFENTYVSGSVTVNMIGGDLIRVIAYSDVSFIALRSDGKPCSGASSGGSAGTGNDAGDTGGPVKMTFRVDNAVFKASLVFPQVAEGFTYDINSALPNVKISDFFKSVSKGFNLLVEPDKSDGKHIVIKTRNANPLTEGYYSSDNIIDWTSKVDLPSGVNIRPMGDLNAKNYLFTYSEGQDFHNQNFKNNYGGNDNRLYGDRLITVDNDFVTDTNETKLIFNPTPIVGPDVAYNESDKVISTNYILDNDGTIKKTGGIKMLLFNIRGTDIPWNLIRNVETQSPDLNIRWRSGDFRFQFYPQAIHLDNHLSPNFDLNFGVPSATYYTPEVYTENNLYKLFHQPFIEEITDKDSKLVGLYAYLKPTDIQRLDFSQLVLFDGHLLRLKKVNEYAVNSKGLTKCEFIKVKTI